jgi:hypothetical protein
VIDAALNNHTSCGRSSFLRSRHTLILSPYIHTLHLGNLANNRDARAGPKASHLVASDAYTGTEKRASGSPITPENVIPIPDPDSPYDPSHLTTISFPLSRSSPTYYYPRSPKFGNYYTTLVPRYEPDTSASSTYSTKDESCFADIVSNVKRSIYDVSGRSNAICISRIPGHTVSRCWRDAGAVLHIWQTFPLPQKYRCYKAKNRPSLIRRCLLVVSIRNGQTHGALPNTMYS